ncbi:MAG: phytoene/squalene synthase family protein [Verrucomicrobiota bacterium]
MENRISAAYESARLETQFHAKSFYFSSFALPRLKRRRAYAIYALCRLMDDRVDNASIGEDLDTVVAELRELLVRIYQDRLTDKDLKTLPWLPAVQETIQRCEVPNSYFQDLIEGVELDQGEVRLNDWNELDRYCYLVAGVVGLIMTRIFELEDRAYETQALDLGCAMQLTNILRDIADDLKMNRVYLPKTELYEYGLNEGFLKQGIVNNQWKKFMKFQIQRARDYYTKSEIGIRELPNDGSRRTVWVMRDVYAGILSDIERSNYNVFQRRCHVTLPKKCALVLKRILFSM